MSRRELNRELNELKVTVWIGKNGIGESTIDEIKRQIKDSGKIKIKWLRSTDVNPEEIADKTGSTLLQTRGRTMVLQKRKK
ncbi:YhbY family RNA-binding protein [Methanoplanus endosymbiosus]|uniref:YhbY family RNA-binding protein n=1 Tax=Methanoplanus endosymbiosus TaxID=33865 RepID=A0A9E7PPR3_9EURY|nr:YhbY family RNA-binding protein [Methanoplanus endosymbiosus]UUX92771.1 YhbY family RNA-binding protein [Methanoplanus endosymbiosus]